MKLLNQSLTIISVFILVIIGLWAVVFYYNIIGEVKKSVDEGLSNYKRQIIFQAHEDTAVLKQVGFSKGFYSIQEITSAEAFEINDTYADTLIFMQKGIGVEPEPDHFRMLTTAFEDNGYFYKLKVINSMVEKDDLINQMFRTSLWLYAILIASIILINNLVLRRIWRPFYQFLGQLKRFRLGSAGNFPLVKTGTREFKDLQDAVHILLRHNTASFEQQKQFIGNAAHELQTPLATTLNKLELLVEKGNLKDDQIEDIGEIMNVIERMTLLNKSLLLLTRIENHQFLDKQKISLNRITEKGIGELEEIASFRKIGISAKETAELTVEMDPALAEILIFNLLRNAVFHSDENGRVSVNISENQIECINDGEKPLDPDVIFNRFQKSGRQSGGSGLGLSIVKAICDMYGFEVLYYFQNRRHHFIVRFNK